MKEENLDRILIFVCVLLGMIIGWCLTEIYHNYEYQRELDGLYFENWSIDSVNSYLTNLDPKGNWVCVNVRGMTFSEGLETCRHEVFHEIWAKCGEAEDLQTCVDKYKGDLN